MDAKSQELLKAFDSSTLTGKLVALNTEQATQFVDFIVDESSLLKQVRLVKTDKPNKDFAQMFPKGRFLRPGKRGIALTAAEEQEFGSDTFTLSTELVRGRMSFTDEDLQDNIEGKGLSDHFLRVIAKQIANEIEEIAIYSKKSAVYPDASTLNQFDGWKVKLIADGNIVDANNTGLFTDRLVSREKFVKAHKALATKYRNGIKNFLPSDVYIDYTELFTTGAVVNNRSEITSSILGKPVVEVPLMRVDEPVLRTGGYSTTVAAAIDKAAIIAGEDTVSVPNGTYVAGQDVAIAFGTAEEQIVTIKTVGTPGATNTDITMTENLILPVALGATFKQVTRDAADVIVTDPNNLLYVIQTTEMEFESYRVPSVGWTYYYKMRIAFGVENAEAAVLLRNLKIK